MKLFITNNRNGSTVSILFKKTFRPVKENSQNGH